MVTKHGKTHLFRYRQIAAVLARHGLVFLLEAFGLTRYVPFHRVIFKKIGRPATLSPPEHLRLAFEELGPTFIKFGQILSTRPDLVPPAYLVEIAKLQDQVPSVSSDKIQKVLEKEFGKPLNQVFATFDNKPLAAASIGQVHAATLPDGTKVVVKVRRPEIVSQIEEDLEIIQKMALSATRHWQSASQYDLTGIVGEFARTLRQELDYIKEAHNVELFTANFAGNPTIHIPQVYWKTTTSQVITLQRIEGIKINDLSALDKAGVNRKALAARAAKNFLKMIFEDGFYHADIHPGNFFVEPGGRIGLVDFGMVGRVDKKTRHQLVGLILAVVQQDTDSLVDTFLELGVARQPIKREVLKRDLSQFISRYYDGPLGELNLGKLIEEVMVIISLHHVQLPSDLALLLKTLVMSEGLGTQLDPTFKLTYFLQPYVKKMIQERMAVSYWLPQLGQAGLNAAQVGLDLPVQVHRLLEDLEHGNLEVGVQSQTYQPFLNRLERLVNRLVLGIVVAAFINGLAILLAFYHPLDWLEWGNFFFTIGIIVTTCIGIYLSWVILWSGRHR